MRFTFKKFRHRKTTFAPLNAHLRRDIGLPEIDRSDWLIGRQIASAQGWM